MPDIEFNLLNNAVDSLKFAVEVLVSSTIGHSLGPDESIYKQAIVSSAHSIELLLKERLRREHPAFIWRNIDKYPSRDAFTVDTEIAVKRLESLANLQFSDADKEIIKNLRTVRNSIEHYEWHTNHDEAKNLIALSMAFAFSFSEHELGTDISETFKEDDTWRTFIEDMYQFAGAYGDRIAQRQRDAGGWTVYCDECQQETVPIGGGVCLLCGHWQDDDDDEQ